MLKCIINVFGGPGTGKTTVSNGLIYNLKMRHYNVEYVPEYAKDLTYEKRFDILKTDQLYVFAMQHRRISIVKNDVEYIITDSPLLLSCTYYNDDNIYNKSDFNQLVINTFNKYPNFNIYLQRTDEIPYITVGRYQDINGAKKIDNDVLMCLNKNNIKYNIIEVTRNNTLDNILDILKLNSII